MRVSVEPAASGATRVLGLSYRGLAVALMAVGAVARLISLAGSWGKPLGPDASEYLLLAHRYSFAHPLSAGYREPLWRGIVKLATAPFGYSPDAYRCFTTAVSIAALPVAWLLLRRLAERRGLGDRVPLLGLAGIALSLQLIRIAPEGLREDLGLLLAMVVLIPLLGADRTRQSAVVMGVAIGFLSVIRFELATLLLVFCCLLALLRRASWLAPALAAVLIVALAGPWLWANKQRHGSLTYNTQVHATYYWKHEQGGAVLRALASPPGVDPPVRLTWGRYYLDYLGPAETAKRVVTGYPRVLAKVAASQVMPRGAAVSALGANEGSAGWLLTVATLAVALAAGLVFAGVRVVRRRGLDPTFFTALGLLLLSAGPYAALAAFVDIRVLAFTIPLVAVVGAIAVDACLPERARQPLARSAGLTAESGSAA